MKIKKVRKMSIQKQKKMLENKMKLLKWTRLIRNISLVETVLLSPLYYLTLQNCFSHQSTPIENIESTFLIALTAGITVGFQGMTERTIADCATLETLIELKKTEKEDNISFNISNEMGEESVATLLDSLGLEEQQNTDNFSRNRYNM